MTNSLTQYFINLQFFLNIGLLSRWFFDSVILTFSFILLFHWISFWFCCVHKLFVKCFIYAHYRRLCKTTKIFVRSKNIFLCNIYFNTSCFFAYNNLIICIYRYINIYRIGKIHLSEKNVGIKITVQTIENDLCAIEYPNKLLQK